MGMCLASITKKHDSPSKTVRYGWKVFVVRGGHYFGEYMPLCGADGSDIHYPIRSKLMKWKYVRT